MPDLIHTPYSLLDFLAGFLDNSTKEYGVSVLVLRHNDPGKVWLLSFDIERYHLYEQLGIDVGVRYERQCRVISFNQMQHVEYDVFECEKLISGWKASVKIRDEYKRLHISYDNDNDWHPQLRVLRKSGRNGQDWGLDNILVRNEREFFLSDVVYDKDGSDFAPRNIIFDPSQFLWIENLTQKEVSRGTANG